MRLKGREFCRLSATRTDNKEFVVRSLFPPSLSFFFSFVCRKVSCRVVSFRVSFPNQTCLFRIRILSFVVLLYLRFRPRAGDSAGVHVEELSIPRGVAVPQAESLLHGHRPYADGTAEGPEIVRPI